MSRAEIICLLTGCSLGAALQWTYFHWQGLIRTRNEWYRARPHQAPAAFKPTKFPCACPVCGELMHGPGDWEAHRHNPWQL